MKNTVLKMTALLMVLILALGAISCSSEAKKPEQAEGGIDWTKYPEKFEDWTIAEIKDYLRAANIIVNNEWVVDMSAGDLGAIGAKAGTMYVDMTAGTITDIIMQFDADSEALETIRATHDAQGVAMDGVLGNFAFCYGMGSDEEHINALVQAIKDLAAHYGIAPDYLL
jgi:hypothetical protein